MTEKHIDKLTNDFIKYARVAGVTKANDDTDIDTSVVLVEYLKYMGKYGDHKCPIDGRVRPVFIRRLPTFNREIVIADGLGNAYKVYSEGFAAYEDKPKPENLLDPDKYLFERGMTGFDF